MHICTTWRNADGAFLLIRETRNWIDVATHVIESTYERHDHDRIRCLIAPPRWSYWVGGHPRYSLGWLLWSIGQRIYRRLEAMPEAYRPGLSDHDLVKHFGWPAPGPSVGN